MTPRPALVLLAAALALSVFAPAEAQQRQQRRAASPPAAQPLLTVQTDLPASCRVVDRFGASRSREFGSPATIHLQPRQPDDTVVCVRDGKESRVMVPARGRLVAVPVSGATAAATPVRRLVTLADVHPYPGRMRLKPQVEQDLVVLRQRYEEGRVSERDYFKLRREAIARNDDGRVVRVARRAAPRNVTRTS
jgi:hypothetical protein